MKDIDNEISSILEIMNGNAKEIGELTQRLTSLEKINRKLAIKLQSICPHNEISSYRDFTVVHSGFVTISRCTVCGMEFLT